MIGKELARISENCMWAEKLPEDSNDDQPTDTSPPRFMGMAVILPLVLGIYLQLRFWLG